MKSQSKDMDILRPNRGRARRVMVGLLIFTGGFGVANIPGLPNLGQASAESRGALESPREDRTERDLLLALEDRKQELDAHSDELDRREAHLKEAEAKFEVKLAEMESLRGEITTLLAEEKAYQEKKFKDMAKIHAEMPISKSADIISRLSDPVAVKVMLNLKRDRVAKVFAKMKPERALTLSKEYMGLKKD